MNETKNTDPAKTQEAKITRVSPEEWRRVKKGRKLDLDQSVLITSSKVNVKANLRKLRRESAIRKKKGESSQNAEVSQQLDYDQAEADAQAEVVQEKETSEDEISAETEHETLREIADRAKRQRDEFRCLIEFMDHDMADIFDVKRQISNKTITEIGFENLWQLFRPGQTSYLFQNRDDHRRCQAL